VILGVVALFAVKGMIEKKILKYVEIRSSFLRKILFYAIFLSRSMALSPGTDRTRSWLTPPVQPHLTAYAFHLTNPEAVVAGKKPILEERGPFVYKVFSHEFNDLVRYLKVCHFIIFSRL
jgi:hypothetical protein